MKSFVTLLKNELKLNIRNMNMVIFAVIIPLVVLIILGFIFQNSIANRNKVSMDTTQYMT